MEQLVQWLESFSPVGQAAWAGTFTWATTALGAAGVFFVTAVNKRLMDLMLGFAAGIMIAASFFSLLMPALEMSAARSLPVWFPPTTGFLLGSLSLWAIDKILPHLHLNLPREMAEGATTSWRRSTLLILAITLHNIPEGLAVGVAFGAVQSDFASLPGAMTLALGIGIQNIPEGTAVSLPLLREGFSKGKSFWFGQLSGLVEPVAAVIGALVVLQSRAILPYALGFAAGAMIFVVIEELIPEAQREGETDWSTAGAVAGFALMMVLDTALA